MALVHYNSSQEINSLNRQINRLLDDVLIPSNWDKSANFSKFPAAELTETEDNLELKLEITGLSTKDIDIQVMVDRVAITGERKSETQTSGNSKTRSEFHYGKFQRVIGLPVRIQNTKVTADYKNGILHLTLPKSEEEKNKVVKVNLPQAEVTS